MPNNNTTLNCSFYGKIQGNTIYTHTPLKDSEIALYNIHIPNYLNIKKFASDYLDDFEMDRARRYFKENDENTFIICRILLKFILGYHSKTDVKKIHIDTDYNKKPYLKSHPSLFFNVSHSENFGIIGIANNPIGVDIECIKPINDLEVLLPHAFNENDIKFIQNSSNKNRAFFNLWTRKEAFVKALGMGIDTNFIKIPSIDGLHNIDSKITSTVNNWKIQGFEIGDQYLGAVAFEETTFKNEKIKVYKLPNKLNVLMAL